MFRIAFCIALLVAVAHGGVVNVRACRNLPQPHQVRIAGCSQMPCAVRRGSDAVMELDFTANRQISRITPSVNAVVLGLPVNYPLPDALLSACASLLHGASCPIPANRRTSLVFRFPVNTAYPPVTVSVQVTHRAQDNSVISCFNADIQVLR